MDRDALWQAALGELEITLSKPNFMTWFKNTFILDVGETQISIAVPNTFVQEWLRNKYHKQLTEALRKFQPNLIKLEYIITQNGMTRTTQSTTAVETQGQTLSTESKAEPISVTLQPYYLFENFVVGPTNRLAHAAAKAVGEKLGTPRYNPLFIYGASGMGKTHLLHAIGNEILKRKSKTKVVYAPCERFGNEFISSIQKKNLESFKKRYRSAELLLVDDIQFLSGKDGTQEEFFHTFNTLHQDGRQIVLTSDSRPQDIPGMANRLSTRLAWGMVADIQPPDFETRMAIINSKCSEKKFSLEKDVVQYLARTFQSNIRELEGTINSIITHNELYQMPPSLDMVTKIIQDRGTSVRRHIEPNKVIKIVASFFALELNELLGPRRNKELVYPRQIVMYLLRNELNYSFPKIGKELGGKDHTTIIHGCDKITRELTRNESLQRELGLIKEQIYSLI